jgi:tryptophanyl-tRNA synthetase
MQSMTNGGQRPTQADPGDPEICPVGDLHRVFSRSEVDSQIRVGCKTANLRCDECKFKAALSIFVTLQPIQSRRSELEDKADTVWEVLENGAERARKAADVVMKDVRAVTGLSRDLSGIHIRSSHLSREHEEDARDLSAFRAWRGLEPALLAQNLRQLWRKNVLSAELKPEDTDVGEMWLTLNNRRVCVAAAIQNSPDDAWLFAVKPKTYEVLIPLCWGEDDRLHDFIVPQKLYLASWVAAKKAAGKGPVTFSVTHTNGRYLLHIAHSSQPIDITDTERAYGIL